MSTTRIAVSASDEDLDVIDAVVRVSRVPVTRAAVARAAMRIGLASLALPRQPTPDEEPDAPHPALPSRREHPFCCRFHGHGGAARTSCGPEPFDA